MTSLSCGLRRFHPSYDTLFQAAPGERARSHLHSEVIGKAAEILGHDVERAARSGLAGAEAAFARPPAMAGAQSGHAKSSGSNHKPKSCSAENRSNYSITASAMARSVGGTSRPMARAVAKLFTKETPVTFPPGRLKLSTTPAPTGSPPVEKTIGIVDVAALATDTTRLPPEA